MTSECPSVLVVEDEPALRQVIAEGLEAEGFAVAQALDGNDALDRLHGFAYDALVVDLGLPDRNGMDILEEAMSLYPSIARSSSRIRRRRRGGQAIKRARSTSCSSRFKTRATLALGAARGIDQLQLKRKRALQAQLQPLPLRQHHQRQPGDAHRLLKNWSRR
jgi:CheY-like chemotaxis protein